VDLRRVIVVSEQPESSSRKHPKRSVMTATSPDRSGDEVATFVTTTAAREGHRVARRRRALLGSVLGVVLIAQAFGPATPAVAAAHDAEPGRQPLAREQIDERFVEEPDPFALDVCGVEVRVEGRVRGHYVLYGDLTARQHLNIEITWSDLQSGDTLLVERDAETFFQVPISETVDAQAGTLTLVYETTITGLPLKGIVPGDGVLIRDAGWITELVTVVLDLATGEEISVDGQFLGVRGPHPFAGLTPAERDALFCGALAG
jgi:hypothetical protein